LRGVVVFALMAVVTRWAFGVSFVSRGWLLAGGFVLGLLLSAGGVGLLVAALLLVFGVHAEVTVWSGVSLMLLVCGIYYPVSLLPEPLTTLAAVIPLTPFLEAFREGYGFVPVFAAPWRLGFLLALIYLAAGYATFTWAIARARQTGMLLKLSD